MVKEKEVEEKKEKKKKMSFLVNFFKKFSIWYRKTFGDEVRQTIIISRAKKKRSFVRNIRYIDAETEHNFLYLSLPCAISPGI